MVVATERVDSSVLKRLSEYSAIGIQTIGKHGQRKAGQSFTRAQGEPKILPSLRI